MTSVRHPERIAAVALVLLVFLAAQVTHAQGFMVRPTVIDVELVPGRTSRVSITLQNTTADDQTLDLAIRNLSQTPDGSWRLIEPGAQDLAVGRASVVPWVRLEASSVEVGGQQSQDLQVTFDVPADARGSYFGAITAQVRPPERQEGIQLILRFMIPLIVQIEGRPARQQVVIEDAHLTYRPASQGQPATTLAHVRVTNKGQTYSRVSGDLRIDAQQGDRWRSVARVDLKPRGIIPGVSLEPGEDLDRRLPSGTYRLRGTLFVDGARAAPLEKIIQFEGDPEITTLALDASLIIDPVQIELEAEAGATRTTVVSVENPLTDQLRVRAQAMIPEKLTGVAMGDMLGEDMSAAEWVQIRPAEFTLRPEGRRNLQVITRMPREGIDQASYYAKILFDAIYPDSQSAGQTQSMLIVANRAVAAEPKLEIERLTVSLDEDERYLIRGQIANVGNVHVVPAVEAELRGLGLDAIARARLESDGSMMLPLSKRAFGGTMEFGDVADGSYILRATVRNDGSVVASRDLRIVIDGEATGSRTVRIAE